MSERLPQELLYLISESPPAKGMGLPFTDQTHCWSWGGSNYPQARNSMESGGILSQNCTLIEKKEEHGC